MAGGPSPQNAVAAIPFTSVSPWPSVAGYPSVSPVASIGPAGFPPFLGPALVVIGRVAGQATSFVSPDNGVTWYQTNLAVGLGVDANCMAYSPTLKRFVMLSDNEPIMQYSDNNGIDWSDMTVSPTPGNWNGVCWSSALALFIAVAINLTNTAGLVSYSADGKNWTTIAPAAMAGANAARKIAWCSGTARLVAVALTGGRNFTSADAINWIANANVSNFSDIASDGAQVVAPGFGFTNDRHSYTSPTGAVWVDNINVIPVAPFPFSTGYVINWNGTAFVLTDSVTPAIWRTVNGAVYTGPATPVVTAWQVVTSNGVVTVAVAQNGTTILSLDNGVTWALGGALPAMFPAIACAAV